MTDNQIHELLGVFLDPLRLYAISIVKANKPNEEWEGEFFSSLYPDQQQTWNNNIRKGTSPINCIDYGNLYTFFKKFKNEIKATGLDESNVSNLITIMSELKEVRNKCQHYTPLAEDDADRSVSNMKKMANLLKMPDLKAEIERKVNQFSGNSAPNSVVEPTISQPSSSVTSSTVDTNPLISWYNNVIPHFDIRSGNLDESVFAANINEVASESGPEVYRNASMFFSKTYITAGLHDIANRVVKALNGEATENRVISLQTGFGGGKTHTLITLYHVVKSGADISSYSQCGSLLDNGLVPHFNNAKVVVFTNNTTDVAQGHNVEEGITIHTLWGEIAYQLGGKTAYEKIRANDEQMTSPASSIMQPIIAEAGTSLILIDELATYCVNASSKKIGGSTLSDQTIAFMQTLTEMVSSIPQCVLICTLPASATEVANSSIGQTILDALHNRVVRISATIKPVDDDEIFEVVRRRLFEEISDYSVVESIANKYKDMYHNRRADLPADCTKVEYAERIKKSYPFHPELIEMFRQRWGSDSKFQRTRGVLRLLASIIQDLWKRKSSLVGTQALIHTSDVFLENLPTLTGTITTLMGSNWETVMLADVYGNNSNSYKIDQLDPQSNIAQYRITQGLATTLLMASVGVKGNKGLKMDELKLCMLKPSSFNHNDIDAALGKFESVAHYMHVARTGGVASYWFEAKANINILLSQAKGNINVADVEAEIINRLKNACSFINNIKVLVNPNNDVPEQKNLTLIVLPPKLTAKVNGEQSYNLTSYVSTLATKRGGSDRIYRNTIFYLACSEAGKSTLSDKISEYLSCQRVIEEQGGRLEIDQRNDIQNRKKDFDQQISTSLAQAYNIAIRHSAGNGLDIYALKDSGTDLSDQIRRVLLTELGEEEWILKSLGRAKLNEHNLLPKIDSPIKVKDIYEAFIRFDDKPMITGPEAIIGTINMHCTNGIFNVAVGDGSTWSRIFSKENVPFLSVESDEYYLVDTTIVNKPISETPAGQQNVSVVNDPPGQYTTSTSNTNTVVGPKNYRTVSIKGKVPIENYSDLFSSFINVLKNNNLKIEISLTATNTTSSPLTENSTLVNNIKESANQLGLNINLEE